MDAHIVNVNSPLFDGIGLENMDAMEQVIVMFQEKLVKY